MSLTQNIKRLIKQLAADRTHDHFVIYKELSKQLTVDRTHNDIAVYDDENNENQYKNLVFKKTTYTKEAKAIYERWKTYYQMRFDEFL